METPWIHHYPASVPAHADVDAYQSLVELIEQSFDKYRNRTAYTFMGKPFTFHQIDKASQAFGAYLKSLGLQPGDRVAAMLPNVPQYPVVIAGILRAGLVLVNINPLYTPRELEHQLKDSGAKAIIILENFAKTLQAVADKVPVQHTIVASMGDMLGFKGLIVNYVVRNVKKLVPSYHLPKSVTYKEAISLGSQRDFKSHQAKPNDLAVLQYTGGTTGLSKGAMLLHRNLVANIIQSEAWYQPALTKVKPNAEFTMVCALPIYHIFGFTCCIMLGLKMGSTNMLIPNPRDLPALFKELKTRTFHSFPAVNTLFNAMANHAEFSTVDWSHLVLCVGGGSAVQSGTAALWLEKTGCPICEGYGLSETSPSAICNRVDSTSFTGTIGYPISNTEVKIIDDDGVEVPYGQPGEIALRGPQIMAGYWQRPDETANVMTTDGFFRSGDVGVITEQGFFKIVDRKKDMILVSGFNVYPNEVEDVVSKLAGVLECAVIGIPDDKTGEAVKLVVVKKDPNLTEETIRKHCETELTGYKKPKIIEFRTDLPKTTVGKILRRELRN